MKAANLFALAIALPLAAAGQGIDVDWSQYGSPIDLAEDPEDEAPRERTELDIEIAAFLAEHKARAAVLINNSGGRSLDDEGRIIGSEALGRLIDPLPVIIIAEPVVADPVAEFYSSIKKLPDCAHTVRILYTESADRSESSLLGYTIEDPKGVCTKLVKYDGKTEWLEWVTKSFEAGDAELSGADQPAAAPGSKPEGESKLQLESGACTP